MFLKEFTMPQRYIKTTVLERRLILGHPKHPVVEKDLAKRRAGYWGEFILNSFLKELPQDQYLIFHDLQLNIENVTFQIDFLLLSHYLNLLIEAKNILGTLTFDSRFKQLLRKNDDGSEDVFEDPRTQAKYHQLLLKRWLCKHGITHLPIDYLVFFSNVKKTILKTPPGDNSDFSRVCKGRELFLKLDGFEKAFQQNKIAAPELVEIGNLLLTSHSSQNIDILNEYSLGKKDIRPGACCPVCSFIPMIYVRGQFSCPVCNCKTKTAIQEGIQDYFYLYKPTITNLEFREFLQVPSPNIAQKILQSQQLQSTGSTRNRIYFL